MSQPVSLILHNARVLTMDCLRPRAQAVAVSGERIAAVGRDTEILPLRCRTTRVIDCHGFTLLPGLNDAHCHLLSTAASLTGLDCRPGSAGSISELLRALRERASELPPGRWIRGFGLDPAQLLERRFPTLAELDWAAPEHPVRLDHVSGHAVLLNRLGLAAAGIDTSTPDPVDGVIERDALSGDPTGVLYEMSSFLRERLGSTRSPEEQERGVAFLSELLLSYGVTSVQDAGPTNGLDQWAYFERLTARNALAPRVTMMAGAGKLEEFLGSGMAWGSGDDRLRLGHAKIMLTLTTGALYPAAADLAALASGCLNAGFPFAIHAVEREALAAVLDLPQLRRSAVTRGGGGGAKSKLRGSPPPNRIEHAAECPADLMPRLAASGATVVTQPGFIYWRGDGYLEHVDPALRPHLYNSDEMRRRNVPVAFSSDAPVTEPSPWPGVYAAVTSLTESGSLLKRNYGNGMKSEKTVAARLHAALAAWTLEGARAEGTAKFKGSVRPGMLADLALLDICPDGNDLRALPAARSMLTVLGGQVVWQQGLDS